MDKSQKTYLAKYWKKHKWNFMLGVLLVTCEAVCDLFQPRLMSLLVDEGAAKGSLTDVWRYGGMMIAIALLGLVFAFSRNYVATHVSQRFGAELRLDIFKKIQSMSVYELDSFEEGSLITRQINDVTQLQNFSAGLMRVVVRAPVICVGAIFMVISQSLQAVPVIFPVVAASAIIITICMKLAYPRYAKVQIALDKLNTVIREYLAGIRLVKAYRRFKGEEERFDAVNTNLTEATINANRVLVVLSPLMAFFINMGIALILWLGAGWVDYGDMPVGQIMALLSYMTQILMSINIISNILNIFVRVKASHRRIADVFDTGGNSTGGTGGNSTGGTGTLSDSASVNGGTGPAFTAPSVNGGTGPAFTVCETPGAAEGFEALTASGTPAVPKAPGSAATPTTPAVPKAPGSAATPTTPAVHGKAPGSAGTPAIPAVPKAPGSAATPTAPAVPKTPGSAAHIVFQSVGLAYRGSRGRPALTDINFTLQKGETLGIIGPTGSGKSSLAALLMRFYEPTSGGIYINGQPLAEIDETNARSRIAIVPQTPMLFSGTIRENIAWGKPDAADEEIETAARDAQALEFIAASPDGMNREVGQAGSGLSGGQKQRISIARALIRRPELLVLDDCTSALDVITETAVKEALNHYPMTTLLITQRVSTVRGCDKILVLENGTQAGFGTHEDLTANCPVYADICRSQIGADT